MSDSMLYAMAGLICIAPYAGRVWGVVCGIVLIATSMLVRQ